MRNYLQKAIDKKINQVVHIDDVPSGIGYICPWCKSDLKARHKDKALVYTDHFAHINRKTCYESQLHSLAEQIILDNNRIYLPDIGNTDYFEPLKEFKIEQRRVDNFIKTKETNIAIEIIVHNPLENDKIEWFENRSDFYSLSIQLFPDDYSKDLFSKKNKKKVIDQVLGINSNKKWIKAPILEKKIT